MNAPRTPAQLLLDAKVIEAHDAAVPTATWGRAVAAMARQAMERALTEFWQQVEPDMAKVRNQRVAFLCLRQHLDEDAAAHAYHSWSVISRACHFSSYDVEPSVDEVRGWLDGAERFLRALDTNLRHPDREHEGAP